ncbi:MAG: Fis family transcriptional regulator [bacterium (Candidatus Stahlbacteria) CG08_land_8_20_14_0_20_40_26]|nr:MAG: Fis family transcriptional regulator [bacterium (Candidatus Stahlbacteria) CG23_combo_of_CG06-09_8_20_14_all_40_9]PIS23475.1 MAG: Fis family transcriptional regulator [bacterium (Candidatus Stahlbacteria) CG08_land_8_20_14_0_20_40_26]
MKEKPRILVVDDELIIRQSLSDWLAESGYEVEAVEDGFKAIGEVKKKKWDLLLVDLKMQGMDGIDVMREAKRISKELPVVIITGYPTVDSAVQAMKEGAYDYIVKPFNPEEIDLVIRNIIAHQNLVKENIYLRQELKRRYQFKDIIGKSRKMQEVLVLVKTVAKSNSTVLIQGESGTGKELIARAIHSTSPRSKCPFVAVSCAALPETLLESELFGHEKGAFTNAISLRKGKFELADKGTLFLDEVGDMSQNTQADLLRVLEEREFRRIGGSELIKVDVRVISATNKELEKLVKEEKFREDLYYRLNVVCIQVPPLRERREDIPLLVEHFLTKYSIENKKGIEFIDEDALRLLMRYNWPGNVRELENVIERAVVVAKKDFIGPDELPPSVKGKPKEVLKSSVADHNLSLQEIEKRHISQVLEATNWNIKEAANILKIDRTTLYNKIKKYKLTKPA